MFNSRSWLAGGFARLDGSLSKRGGGRVVQDHPSLPNWLGIETTSVEADTSSRGRLKLKSRGLIGRIEVPWQPTCLFFFFPDSLSFSHLFRLCPLFIDIPRGSSLVMLTVRLNVTVTAIPQFLGWISEVPSPRQVWSFELELWIPNPAQIHGRSYFPKLVKATRVDLGAVWR